MKKLLLSLACVGLVSVPAFAGSCPSSGGGGCDGGKAKEGEKPKDPVKQTLVVQVLE